MNTRASCVFDQTEKYVKQNFATSIAFDLIENFVKLDIRTSASFVIDQTEKYVKQNFAT